MYPVKRKWQPESCPPPIVKEAPLDPIKKPASVQTIPGLTLYLQPTDTSGYYGPHMVLFESFIRSNVNFSFDSNKCSWTGLPCKHPESPKCACPFMTNLFIEGKLISTGYHKKLNTSKAEAAGNALVMLRECQPTHINSAQESYYMKDEVIPGLVLHVDSPKQLGKKHHALWYDILMKSCKKCGLKVSWWQNFDSLFRKKWSVVLVIDSKPICFAWKESLDEAKRVAVSRIVPLLKSCYPIQYKTDNSVSKLTLHLSFEGEEKITNAYRILQRSAAKIGKLFHMRDRTVSNEETGNTSFFSDLYFYSDHVASGIGTSKKEARSDACEKGLQELMKIRPVVFGEEDPLKKNVSASQHPKSSDKSQKIPGLICYMKAPVQGKRPKFDTRHDLLMRAASRFGSSIRVHEEDRTFNAQHQLSLYIGEHLFATGCGNTYKAARKDAFRKAQARLVSNQPIVYILPDGTEIQECDYNETMKSLGGGSSTQKNAGKTLTENVTFTTSSEWHDVDGGSELLSCIISDQDAQTLIEKYIRRHVDI